MLKYILVLCAIIIFSSTLNAQDQASDRYVRAVDYLNTNREELKSEWLNLFTGSTKRTYKKRIGKQLNFRISPKMSFCPILVFRDEIDNLDSLTHLSREEIYEPHLFSSRYGFDEYNSAYLINELGADTSKYDSLQQHKFSIYFSKPVNNFLLAEVTGWDERIAGPYASQRGRSMFMLFIFRKDESLEKVFYSYVDR